MSKPKEKSEPFFQPFGTPASSRQVVHLPTPSIISVGLSRTRTSESPLNRAKIPFQPLEETSNNPMAAKIGNLLAASIQKLLKESAKTRAVQMEHRSGQNYAGTSRNLPLTIAWINEQEKFRNKSLGTWRNFHRKLKAKKRMSPVPPPLPKLSETTKKAQPLITLSTEEMSQAALPVLQQDGVAYFIPGDFRNRKGNRNNAVSIRSRSLSRPRKSRENTTRQTAAPHALNSYVKGESVSSKRLHLLNSTNEPFTKPAPKIYSNFVRSLRCPPPSIKQLRSSTPNSVSNNKKVKVMVQQDKTQRVVSKIRVGVQSVRNSSESRYNRVILMPQVFPILCNNSISEH